MNLARRFRNLVGIPSYHYEPVFAQAVRRALRRVRPTAVALEVPPAVATELAWADTCWPGPVVVLAEPDSKHDSSVDFFPFVPGDSIFEAYRLAGREHIDTFCIDLDVHMPRERPQVALPGPEFAPRVGRLFLDANDALDAAAGAPDDRDLAREAHMARELSGLMQAHHCVLWVGGMAHWTRIVERLGRGDFEAPQAAVRQQRRFRRLRLAPSALLHTTHRLPYLVAQYASDPDRYHEARMTRALALEAVGAKDDGTRVVVGPAGLDAPTAGVSDCQAAPIDVARLLLYARNLAAGRRLSEQPSLGELLTAAAATIGNRYAGRLYALATAERTSETAAAYPALTYEVIGAREGFRLADTWITAKPYWPGDGIYIWVPSPGEIDRCTEDAAYRRMPSAQKQEQRAWVCYPPDETAYEQFVNYVLRRASVDDRTPARSEPFLVGLRDGVDARATLRHWKDGTIYVREDARGPVSVTNGVIDFSSRVEDSPVLRGEPIDGRSGGWIDPSCLHVGSASRHFHSDVLQDEPCHVSVPHRELSLITLDCPTWIKKDDSKSFYSRVIQRLIELPSDRNNLYGWLEVMFSFCRGKPVAYYSSYMPGPRIHEIARTYSVQVIHCPLERIPKPLLERHRTFRFLWLTRAQWEALLERIAEGKTAWLPAGRRGGATRNHGSRRA
jgi:hypothetical protein